jgi:hypothetical protein
MSFDPTAYTGLSFDLDPTIGIYSDAGTTAAVDGALVQQANDQGGGGHNVSQATSGLRPTFKTNIINGKPVLRFSHSANTRLLSSALGTALTQPNTIYAVVIPTTASLTGLTIFIDGVADASRNAMYLNSGTYGWYAGSLAASSTAGVNGTAVVASAVFNGASSLFRINGGSDDTGSPGAASMGGFSIGNYWGGGFGFDGDIARVLVYHAAHNSTDRASVMSGLGLLYGVFGTAAVNMSPLYASLLLGAG